MERGMQAPLLVHEGTEENPSKGKYIITNSLIETIFNEISGKNGNTLKLILFLLGNNGYGKFRISERTVVNATGMNQKSYRRARQDLIDKGWIRHENGMIIVNINNIKSECDFNMDERSE